MENDYSPLRKLTVQINSWTIYFFWGYEWCLQKKTTKILRWLTLEKRCWQNWKCCQTFMKNYDFCLESAHYSKAHISQNSQWMWKCNNCNSKIHYVIVITLLPISVCHTYELLAVLCWSSEMKWSSSGRTSRNTTSECFSYP